MKREGGYIGTQPNWDGANRPGNWSILDVYNRQRRNLWIQSTDPFVNNVVCDLRFEGANNGIVFNDNGPLLLPVSRLGTTGVVTSTARSKYGSASGLFPDTNGYLSISHPSLALGTGNFTIEVWLFAATSRGNNGILSFGTSNSTFTNILFATSNLLNVPNASNIVAVPLNTWFHVAYVREGVGTNQTKTYLNGTLINQFINTVNYNQTFYNIGVYFSTGYCWGANMDNFRVTKAVRYRANFNPEIDTYMS
ncbi:hypothetical protein MaMV-DH010048 [Cyanophage MaMV-DH01]|nr:hypothetical protein MaMV-DH010048 [Cyanophage MaMV-DH01]